MVLVRVDEVDANKRHVHGAHFASHLLQLVFDAVPRPRAMARPVNEHEV